MRLRTLRVRAADYGGTGSAQLFAAIAHSLRSVCSADKALAAMREQLG